MRNSIAPCLSEVLKSVIYDPETGTFTRLSTGRVTGDTSSAGYVRLRFGSRGSWVSAHRLAWFIMTGDWPEETVDHKNRNKADNRWCNLRLATRLQQNHNQGLSVANKSGAKGVFFRQRDNVWIASIRVGGRKKHIGSFRTREAAIEAYENAAKVAHGEFFFGVGVQHDKGA